MFLKILDLQHKKAYTLSMNNDILKKSSYEYFLRERKRKTFKSKIVAVVSNTIITVIVTGFIYLVAVTITSI